MPDVTFTENTATLGNGGAIDNYFYNSDSKDGYVYIKTDKILDSYYIKDLIKIYKPFLNI